MRIGTFCLLSCCIWLLTGCGPSAKLSHYSAYHISSDTGTIPSGKVRVTFLGTSSLLIDDGETQLLTDGFVSRPGALKTGFGKIGADTAIIREVITKLGITGLKAIFCAHSHYDHAMDAPYVGQLTGADLHGSPSTLNIGRGAGLSDKQLFPYEPGKEMHFGKFTVTILASKHSHPFKILGKSNDDLGETIDVPLHQPVKADEYKEGGAYDILIKHGSQSILVKASTNFIEGALDTVQADVLFLGIARLGEEGMAFRDSFYRQTIGAIHPKMVVPVHWDNFFKPLSPNLKPLPKLADDVDDALQYLIRRTEADSIKLRIMQGYDSMLLP